MCRLIGSLVWISGIVSQLSVALLTTSHLIVTKYALIISPMSNQITYFVVLCTWVLTSSLFVTLLHFKRIEASCLFFEYRMTIPFVIHGSIIFVMVLILSIILIFNYMIYIYISHKNVQNKSTKTLKLLLKYLTCVSLSEIYMTVYRLTL